MIVLHGTGLSTEWPNSPTPSGNVSDVMAFSFMLPIIYMIESSASTSGFVCLGLSPSALDFPLKKSKMLIRAPFDLFAKSAFIQGAWGKVSTSLAREGVFSGRILRVAVIPVRRDSRFKGRGVWICRNAH